MFFWWLNHTTIDLNLTLLIHHEVSEQPFGSIVYFYGEIDVFDYPRFRTHKQNSSLLDRWNMLKSTSKCYFPLASPHLPPEVRILVQGFRETPDVVATLIDQTVKNLTQSFHQMSPKEFEVSKALRRWLVGGRGRGFEDPSMIPSQPEFLV